jgi:GT2 family glycosyltransferase
VIVSLESGPDVVAVIPTLGRELERLRTCLESIHRSKFDGRLAIIVIWNDPRRPVPDLGEVTVLEPGMNLGFPVALNVARNRVNTPYLWIVQDDQTVEVGCLQLLSDRIQAADRPAIVRPIVINDAGRVPATSCGGILRDGGARNEPYPSSDITPNEIDNGVRLDWVTLSGALVRCEVWDEVGGMDPMFFPLQWSDIDLGYRMTKIGSSVVLEPQAKVTHQRFGSTPTLFRHFLSERNQSYFLEKHRSGAPSDSKTTVETPAVTELIAREASLLLLDFASYAEKEMHQLKNGPMSRLARPVRSLIARVGRLRQR